MSTENHSFLVSIIIPTYNAEMYIKDTLDSCIRQSYKNIEIIIINDSSTDSTLSIIQGFSDIRIKLFTTDFNIGAQNSRNLGIKKSNGSLIQFLDHDDILDFEKIYHQVNLYKKFGFSFLYSSKQGTIYKNKKYLENNFNIYYKSFSPLEYFQLASSQFGTYFSTGNWLVPKCIIDSNKGWNAKAGINDDGEYFMRLILSSKGIIFSKDSTFYFRCDAKNSLSKIKPTFKKYHDLLFSYKSYSTHFERFFNQTDYKILSLKYFSKFYCTHYPLPDKLRKECLLEIKNLGFEGPLPAGKFKFKILCYFLGVEPALKFRYLFKLFYNKKKMTFSNKAVNFYRKSIRF